MKQSLALSTEGSTCLEYHSELQSLRASQGGKVDENDEFNKLVQGTPTISIREAYGNMPDEPLDGVNVREVRASETLPLSMVLWLRSPRHFTKSEIFK